MAGRSLRNVVSAPTGRWRGQREQSGLLASLADLSLRSSLVAISVPVATVAIAWAAGRPLHETAASQLDGAALAAIVATFVLVPMFALTGAATAVVVAAATLASHREPVGVRVSRAAFSLAVGGWAVTMAVAYDLVAVPRISG